MSEDVTSIDKHQCKAERWDVKAGFTCLPVCVWFQVETWWEGHIVNESCDSDAPSQPGALNSCVHAQAVIAHELGHLKCDHGIWLTIANVLASGTISLPIISGVVEESFMRWLRAAELTCDRAAMLVAQDHKIVISTLMKLAGGSPGLASELNIDAFLRQV